MTKNPLISFLVPDTGSPTIGAALKLARMLEPEYRTEILGPDFGRGVCSLYRDAYPFRAVPAGRLYRLPDYLWESRRLAREIRGDLVIAVKAFATTVPVALRAGRAGGVPVAVYMDEWDASLWHTMSSSEKAVCVLRHAHHPAEPCYHPLVERSVRRADAVLSTTTWLRDRFGGIVLHAGVDCDFFRPQDPGRVAKLKEDLGLSGKKVIVFGGVVRPHKGVEEILEALIHLGRSDIALLVVGPVTEHLAVITASPRTGRYVTVAGDAVNGGTSLNADIHKLMPLHLDVGDLVVLPLRDTLLAQSQMPIKLFEAMAMGKPVIGTAVSDLPMMLEGCGRVVPPGDGDALARAIEEVLSDDAAAREMGARAREKCVREYSTQVSRRNLLGIVDGLLGGAARS